ncbi:hypothetical protein BURMUCGD1_1389 [Burkholderia multivorans CGD1]|nr:hypothetical protein BURMUCGD1_1389 [Burkholderia multivorans CGD1]
MPRSASAGAAFLFSLYAHRRRPPRVPPGTAARPRTRCGNSPRFLL